MLAWTCSRSGLRAINFDLFTRSGTFRPRHRRAMSQSVPGMTFESSDEPNAKRERALLELERLAGTNIEEEAFLRAFREEHGFRGRCVSDLDLAHQRQRAVESFGLRLRGNQRPYVHAESAGPPTASRRGFS